LLALSIYDSDVTGIVTVGQALASFFAQDQLSQLTPRFSSPATAVYQTPSGDDVHRRSPGGRRCDGHRWVTLEIIRA
jgi:hypothetical protein